MRWYKRRAVQLGAGMAAIAMLAGACSSSAKTNGNGGTSATTGGSNASNPLGTNGQLATVNGIPNQIFDPNSVGTPVTGGTLTMLGTGDVDYMDPNVSYYSIGYLGLRMWSRQLYNYPAVESQTTTVVPDLATAMPTITNGGLKYAVTIRQGAMWNTTPPRQVTAADVILGVKRSCNPTQPFGGQPDFSDVLAGYASFCTAFGKVSATSASAQAAFINGNQISGVTVDPSDSSGLTVDFTLTKPASYFTDVLALPPFAPAATEYLQYLPASAQLAQHTVSDGPYYVASYDPAKTIVFKRNTAWKASTDPIRKAYVNEIDVNETGDQQAIQQEISTNVAAADMEWDSFVPSTDIPGLVASHNANLTLQSTYATNPYIIFNTQSPNNSKALQNTAVRQAIAYAINRGDLIQDLAGPQVSPPLTQILPPGIGGSSPTYDPYPQDTAKAKTMLAAAGASHLTLKFLYRPKSVSSSKIFQTLQADLAAVGITLTGVGVPNADFYTKYLQVPTQAKNGVWDLSLAGWSPDWYGDAAKSFFLPLFDGRIQPPTSSNFGLYSSTKTEALIDQALAATSSDAAATIWHQADQQVMSDVAIYPITDGNIGFMRGSQVHNSIYVPQLEQIDPTNVWLSS